MTDAELDSIRSYQDAILCLRLRHEAGRELSVAELLERLGERRGQPWTTIVYLKPYLARRKRRLDPDWPVIAWVGGMLAFWGALTLAIWWHWR